jgi:hypothetical protein
MYGVKKCIPVHETWTVPMCTTWSEHLKTKAHLRGRYMSDSEVNPWLILIKPPKGTLWVTPDIYPVTLGVAPWGSGPSQVAHKDPGTLCMSHPLKTQEHYEIPTQGPRHIIWVNPQRQPTQGPRHIIWVNPQRQCGWIPPHEHYEIPTQGPKHPRHYELPLSTQAHYEWIACISTSLKISN